MLPEMTILMLTLFHEGSICSESELSAICRTIQVSAEEKKTSISTECLRPFRYSCWNGYSGKHKILKAYRGGQCHGSHAWERCRKVAQAMYDGKLDGMPRWNHYYNPKLCKSKPMWAKDLTQKRKYAHHIFGRIGK